MLTTIRKILRDKGISIQDTIYGTVEECVLDFPINIGDFFNLSSSYTGESDFSILNDLYRLAEGKKAGSEYRTVCSEIDQTASRIKEMKHSETGAHQSVTEKAALRNHKKALEKKKTDLHKKYLAQSLGEIRQEASFGQDFLVFKNSFHCSCFSELAALLPQIAEVDTPKLKAMPLFVRGIFNLSRALEKGKPLGITGGPCLFGTNEVTIDIHHKNGEIIQFDFSTGREYDKSNMLSDISLGCYCDNKHDDIVKLELTNFKQGITRQEYLSIQYLFEFARALGARIVIPIPDMSYMKFFKGSTKALDDQVKQPAFKVFENISNQITDMYLNVIDNLRIRYPGIECQVLHNRDANLCDLFYNRRKQYVSRLFRFGSVTEYEGKLDSVIDYITMVALPYYVYGTKNVLQLDSVDEADSMRKCIKIHGSDLEFHSILFPEYVCQDGVHTVFNAPLEYKDYITTGG